VLYTAGRRRLVSYGASDVATLGADSVQLSPLAARHGRRAGTRVRVIASGTLAGVLGALPHVLHHAGPLAGAALFAGVGGSLLFGAAGLIAAVPFLARVHRRTHDWRVPAALLALFATVFSLSAFVIGPAVTGGDDSERTPAVPGAPSGAGDEDHEAHHD